MATTPKGWPTEAENQRAAAVLLCSDGLEALDDARRELTNKLVVREALAHAGENFNHILRLMGEARKRAAGWSKNVNHARKLTEQYCRDGLSVIAEAQQALRQNNREVLRVAIAEARLNISTIWRLLEQAHNPERADLQ